MRILTALLLLLPIPATADLFGGSDNYDGCVVDRMKGQEIRMINTVRRACERDFEVKLSTKAQTAVDIDWTKTTASHITVTIVSNDSDFQIIRAILVFSSKACGDAQGGVFNVFGDFNGGDFNVFGEADFSHWMPGSDPNLDARVKLERPTDLKCMRTRELFGKRIK